MKRGRTASTFSVPGRAPVSLALMSPGLHSVLRTPSRMSSVPGPWNVLRRFFRFPCPVCASAKDRAPYGGNFRRARIGTCSLYEVRTTRTSCWGGLQRSLGNPQVSVHCSADHDAVGVSHAFTSAVWCMPRHIGLRFVVVQRKTRESETGE
jgi:hypothetical protein